MFAFTLFARQAVTDAKSAAAIEGSTVAAPNGAPLKRSTLWLEQLGGHDVSQEPRYRVTSDSGGKFTFEGVMPGRYQLWGLHPGYPRQRYSEIHIGSRPTPLTIMEGQHLTGIVFQLMPAAAISGQVFDSQGDPLPDAQVLLLQRRLVGGSLDVKNVARGKSDESGIFRLANLHPGSYYLLVEPGLGSVPLAVTPSGMGSQTVESDIGTYYPGVPEAASASLIHVGEGDNLSANITLLRSRVFHVRGHVVSSAPELSDHLSVTLFPSDNIMPFAYPGAVINSDGRFDLKGVAPGAYTLSVNHFDEGLFQVLARQNFDVGDQDIRDLTVYIEPLADISGKVIFQTHGTEAEDLAKGSAFQTIVVSLTTFKGLQAAPVEAKVRGNGTFTLRGLGLGKYRLNVAGLPDGTYLKAATSGNVDVLADGLERTQGASRSIEVTIDGGVGEVQGTVVDSENRQAGSSTVTLVPDPPRADAKRSLPSGFRRPAWQLYLQPSAAWRLPCLRLGGATGGCAI